MGQETFLETSYTDAYVPGIGGKRVYLSYA